MSALSGSISGNHRVYESAEVVQQYASMAAEIGLFPSEAAILERLRRRARSGAVLDIGVGAGRTTPALSTAYARYVGVDYSASMVERCRRDFPHLTFSVQDARDMGEIGDEEFEAVWFSFNGIDYVRLHQRERVLREALRVLKPGGHFVFSTHNLHAPPKPPALWPEWRQDGSWLRRAAANARRMLRHAGWHLNYRVSRTKEIRGEGQALLVDSAHGYRLLTGCVTPQFQVRQLHEAGFGWTDVVAQDGRVLRDELRPGDSWLYYVARKP